MQHTELAADIRSDHFLSKLRGMVARQLRQFPVGVEEDELLNDAWLLVAEGKSPRHAVRLAHSRYRRPRGGAFLHEPLQEAGCNPHSVDEVQDWAIGMAVGDGSAE